MKFWFLARIYQNFYLQKCLFWEFLAPILNWNIRKIGKNRVVRHPFLSFFLHSAFNNIDISLFRSEINVFPLFDSKSWSLNIDYYKFWKFLTTTSSKWKIFGSFRGDHYVQSPTQHTWQPNNSNTNRIFHS